jgi:diguanylate cyclase (GGDEF)-like protein
MDRSPTKFLGSLPSAFAAACRHSHSDNELFERCRAELVQRFSSERIWLTVTSAGGVVSRAGTSDPPADAEEVARLSSGETEVTILADRSVAGEMRSLALPVALGLSVVAELRSVLQERQAALDDATFQLRALRQVTRLLASVRSAEETEYLILDFMSEVFFARWACLYRVQGDAYIPIVYRSVDDTGRPAPIPRGPLETSLPVGAEVVAPQEASLAALVDPLTELIIPLDSGPDRVAILTLGPRIHGKPYGPPQYELAGTLGYASAIALKNAELVEQLQGEATTDPLTGVNNRRSVEERLEAEISRAVRHRLHTTTILIDIDRFKLVNDTMGHAAGDRLLRLIAEVVRKQCRTLDVVGRLGGDEFLVILPMTSARESLAFVARVQREVADLEQQYPEFGKATLSFGIADSPTNGGASRGVLAAADTALYRAKRGGRNAVEIAHPTDGLEE